MGQTSCCCEASTEEPSVAHVIDTHPSANASPSRGGMSLGEVTGHENIGVNASTMAAIDEQGSLSWAGTLDEAPATETTPPKVPELEDDEPIPGKEAEAEDPQKPSEKLDAVLLKPITPIFDKALSEKDGEKIEKSDSLFEVRVSNPNGAKLGFGIGYKQGERHLHVIKVTEEGLIPEWNSKNPDKLVKTGFYLMSINDYEPQPQCEKDAMANAITAACKSADLKLLFKRVELVVQHSPTWSQSTASRQSGAQSNGLHNKSTGSTTRWERVDKKLTNEN